MSVPHLKLERPSYLLEYTEIISKWVDDGSPVDVIYRDVIYL